MSVKQYELDAILSKLMSDENGKPQPHTSYFLFGSSVTCQPPVLDTDIDVGLWGVSKEALLEIGAVPDFKDYDVDLPFNSYRWGHIDHDSPFDDFKGRTVNFVQFITATAYSQHRLAAGLCKLLNLSERDDRIAVFDVARNDDSAYIYNLIPENKIPKGVFQ